MNLIDSFRKHKSRLVILVLLMPLLWTVAIGVTVRLSKPRWRSEMEEDTILGAIQEAFDDLELRRAEEKMKEIEYEEFSPDRSKKIILYKMVFNRDLYSGYYNDYFYNSVVVAAVDIEDRREYYVFTGEERTGNPHWLGNNHVFFTTHCGTACKGVYLVDTGDRETRLAVWGYTFSKEKGSWETHFTDWFDQKFSFDGLVDELKSEVAGNEVYLIFKMRDDQGKPLYDKQFLFTESGLEAVD